jgi:hypothetical protein
MIKTNVAASLGVEAAQVTVTITAVTASTRRRALQTAASVTITIAVKASTVSQKTTLETSIENFLKTPTSASSMFAGSVTVATIVSTGNPYPPPPPFAPPPGVTTCVSVYNATSNTTSTTCTTVAASNTTTSPPSPPVTVIYQNDAVPGWATAIIIVLAVAMSGVCGLVIFMCQKEKSGKPIFTQVVKPKS